MTRSNDPTACPDVPLSTALYYGELDAAEAISHASHLARCPSCQSALRDLEFVNTRYGQVLPPQMESNQFQTMLRVATGRRGHPVRGVAWTLLATAAVGAVFIVGYSLGGINATPAAGDAALAQTSTLSESLFAANRIVAVGGTQDVDALLTVLERDPSPNVRLAAADHLLEIGIDSLGMHRVIARVRVEPWVVLRLAFLDLLADQQILDIDQILEELGRSDRSPAVRAKVRTLLQSG